MTSCFVLSAATARAADTSTEPIPPQVTSAVDRGLDWLASHQDPKTGAWLSGMGGPYMAVTSLAAMAFMARGNVPGQGPYGENINQAVDAILNNQQENGLLSAGGLRQNNQPMYEHGISTVMLCEAYGMLDDRRQQRASAAIRKAVRIILDAQALPKETEDQGGWRYLPTSRDSDISVTGWQLMALRGAANVGAQVPQRAIKDGIAYIKRRASGNGGFTYNGFSDANSARSGTGILALELLGQHHTPEALKAGSFIRLNPPTESNSGWYMYAVYYCAQAAWQLGGDYWNDINRPIRDSLIHSQYQDGSWGPGGGEAAGGQPYATAMAILTLTVPYRYLPIYQR